MPAYAVQLRLKSDFIIDGRVRFYIILMLCESFLRRFAAVDGFQLESDAILLILFRRLFFVKEKFLLIFIVLEVRILSFCERLPEEVQRIIVVFNLILMPPAHYFLVAD